MMTGCQSDQEEKKLYEGLNGKETYQEAVDFFNHHVNYYKSMAHEDNNTAVSELYKIEGKCATVNKTVYEEGEFDYLSYTITHQEEFHSLFLDDEHYTYELMNDYSQQIETMYHQYNDNIYQILDVQRTDEQDHITLELQLKQSQTYQESDEEDSVNYLTNEMKINKDGYITEEKMTYYVDETFEEILQDGAHIEYLDFNQKKEQDFYKEIELMKSCDGLERNEVKERLGL